MIKKFNQSVTKRVVSCLLVVLMMLVGSMSVLAVDSSQEAQAKRELTVYVQSQLSSNDYAAEGGGYIAGSDLFTGSATDGYDLDEDEFGKLTSSAQTELVKDIADKSYDAEESLANVSDDTIQGWWKELQTKEGAGSKFLNVILQNTKPDFVTANKIYEPFSGPISTVIGVIAVLGMALLGVVLVADIFYIVIPPVRMLVSDDGDTGSKKSASKIFSDDAIYSVKVAEESNDAGGNKKQALGVYLKRRIPMLILLGICLMYLVAGKIYTLVGYILDLVSGFVGF